MEKDKKGGWAVMEKTKFRRNIRLTNYDYNTNGYYFVTICTDYRKLLLSGYIKSIVVAELARLGNLKGVSIDYYILMPDHIHMIIVLYDSDYSLSNVVRKFKSKTTVLANKLGKQDGQRQKIADQGRQLQKTVAPGCRSKRLWQPNYYEHIIRNEKALSRIREYIGNNPEKEIYDWEILETM